jgi:hypothetical protein
LLVLLNQNVTPDLLAESVVVSISESEECAVLSRKLRSNKLNGDGDFHTRLDGTINDFGNGLKIITVSLDENGVLWPISVSAVSESPFLDECLKRFHWMLVTKVFLDKSSIKNDLLLSWSSLAGWVWRNSSLALWLALAHLWLRSWLTLVKVHFLALVLERTVKESRGLVTSSYLQKRVRLRICCFTLLTDIEVRSYTALVSDASDRWDITDITDNVVMNLSLLISCSFTKVIYHKSLEGLRSVRFDFLSKNLE